MEIKGLAWGFAGMIPGCYSGRIDIMLKSGALRNGSPNHGHF